MGRTQNVLSSKSDHVSYCPQSEKYFQNPLLQTGHCWKPAMQALATQRDGHRPENQCHAVDDPCKSSQLWPLHHPHSAAILSEWWCLLDSLLVLHGFAGSGLPSDQNPLQIQGPAAPWRLQQLQLQLWDWFLVCHKFLNLESIHPCCHIYSLFPLNLQCLCMITSTLLFTFNAAESILSISLSKHKPNLRQPITPAGKLL